MISYTNNQMQLANSRLQQNHAQKSRMRVSRDVFYVDNYIDWEQYNTLYDADFAETGILATKS
jgi:hypothetical protein